MRLQWGQASVLFIIGIASLVGAAALSSRDHTVLKLTSPVPFELTGGFLSGVLVEIGVTVALIGVVVRLEEGVKRYVEARLHVAASVAQTDLRLLFEEIADAPATTHPALVHVSNMIVQTGFSQDPSRPFLFTHGATGITWELVESGGRLTHLVRHRGLRLGGETARDARSFVFETGVIMQVITSHLRSSEWEVAGGPVESVPGA